MCVGTIVLFFSFLGEARFHLNLWLFEHLCFYFICFLCLLFLMKCTEIKLSAAPLTEGIKPLISLWIWFTVTKIAILNNGFGFAFKFIGRGSIFGECSSIKVWCRTVIGQRSQRMRFILLCNGISGLLLIFILNLVIIKSHHVHLLRFSGALVIERSHVIRSLDRGVILLDVDHEKSVWV